MKIELINVWINNCFVPFWLQIAVIIAIPSITVSFGIALTLFLKKRGRVSWSRLAAALLIVLPLATVALFIISAQVENRKVVGGNVDGLEYIKRQYKGIPQSFDSIGNPNATNANFTIYCNFGTCEDPEITQVMAEYIPQLPGIKEGSSRVRLSYSPDFWSGWAYNLWAAGEQGKAQEYQYLYYRTELRDNALQKIGIDPEVFRRDAEYIKGSPDKMLDNWPLSRDILGTDNETILLISIYPETWTARSKDPEELSSIFREAIDYFKKTQSP